MLSSLHMLILLIFTQSCRQWTGPTACSRLKQLVMTNQLWQLARQLVPEFLFLTMSARSWLDLEVETVLWDFLAWLASELPSWVGSSVCLHDGWHPQANTHLRTIFPTAPNWVLGATGLVWVLSPPQGQNWSTKNITGLLQKGEKVFSQRKTHRQTCRCLYQRPELIVTRIKLKTR